MGQFTGERDLSVNFKSPKDQVDGGGGELGGPGVLPGVGGHLHRSPLLLRLHPPQPQEPVDQVRGAFK